MAFQESEQFKMWCKNVLCLLLILKQQCLVSGQKLDLCVERVEVTMSVSTKTSRTADGGTLTQKKGQTALSRALPSSPTTPIPLPKS